MRCDYGQHTEVQLETARINDGTPETICEFGCGCVSECVFSYKPKDKIIKLQTDWEEVAALN